MNYFISSEFEVFKFQIKIKKTTNKYVKYIYLLY